MMAEALSLVTFSKMTERIHASLDSFFDDLLAISDHLPKSSCYLKKPCYNKNERRT